MKRYALCYVASFTAALMIVPAWFGCAPTANAIPAKPYYEGKTISIIVPTSAGGGTDMFARMVAKHLGKFLPGNPGVVVRNMPGAGQLIGVNYAWGAKPDGLTILNTTGSTPVQNILRTRGTDFWLEQMHPIFASSLGQVYFSRPGIIAKPKDIMSTKGAIFGHDAVNTSTTLLFVLAKELLGFECKLICGYAGSGPANLAFLANEINITGGTTLSYNTTMKSYVNKGEVVPILQSGLIDGNRNIVKDPTSPGVPTPDEIYKEVYGKSPSGDVWEAYKVVSASNTYNKTLLLPKNTPQNIVSICMKAVVEMANDARFLEESERITPQAPRLMGEELARAYRAGISAPEEVIQFLQKLLIDKYGMKFN